MEWKIQCFTKRYILSIGKISNNQFRKDRQISKQWAWGCKITTQ